MKRPKIAVLLGKDMRENCISEEDFQRLKSFSEVTYEPQDIITRLLQCPKSVKNGRLFGLIQVLQTEIGRNSPLHLTRLYCQASAPLRERDGFSVRNCS